MRRLLSSAAAQQNPTYYQPQPQRAPQYNPPKPAARVIRGGNVANTGYTERSFEPEFKPKTVIIPTETPHKQPVTPEDEDVKVFTPRINPDKDVKVFTPRRPAFRGYIEPTPYDEKIKQPLEEYRRSREEEQEAQIEGQISAEEVSTQAESQSEPIPEAVETPLETASASVQPAPAMSAKAISAYRTITLPKQEEHSEKQLEKADFSEILNEMARNDGFKNDDEVEVDSDGIPVSHKTKHVMNALFGPTRVSPFLKVNLDDDDEQ